MTRGEPERTGRRLGIWRSRASVANLRRRAELLAKTRTFFAARGVLEVETPLLAPEVIVEAHVDPMVCEPPRDGKGSRLYLQCSPEAAMKKLLASGTGPIYQISHAFRAGEEGRFHRWEFTLLEWYRPDFDHHDMMAEVASLLESLLGISAHEKKTYAEIFDEWVGLDPHGATRSELLAAARSRDLLPPRVDDLESDDILNLLLVGVIEPNLGKDRITFVYDYPRSQAALACVRDGSTPLAERFEVYCRGIELGNGYHELLDAEEHRRRFDEANRLRRRQGRDELPADETFLAALVAGAVPPCSGVAIGFDRVALLATGAQSIDEVMAG